MLPGEMGRKADRTATEDEEGLKTLAPPPLLEPKWVTRYARKLSYVYVMMVEVASSIGTSSFEQRCVQRKGLRVNFREICQILSDLSDFQV